MSSTDYASPSLAQLAFYRKSESESICLGCFQTVVANRYMSVAQAEAVHRDGCVMVHLEPLSQHPRFWMWNSKDQCDPEAASLNVGLSSLLAEPLRRCRLKWCPKVPLLGSSSAGL